MNITATGPSPGPILKWWYRLAGLPGGSRLFSFLLGRIARYSGSIHSHIEEIRPGYARVSMRDRRALRNHLNSIHAIALINLGEISTGLAVLSTLPENMRGIVLAIRADYLKKARGKLSASAEFQLPPEMADNTPFEVEAQLRDQSGEIVTRVTATWLLGYKNPTE